jgi:hypothetical protein
MSPSKAVLAAVLYGALAVSSAQAGETLRTLKENIFVCVSPQAYDEAMVRLRGLNGQEFEELKKELGEKKQCMFVDAEIVEGIMAPFAVVLERNGSKVQVQFVVTFRERRALLHRLINRYVLVGWTDESNLTPKKIL